MRVVSFINPVFKEAHRGYVTLLIAEAERAWRICVISCSLSSPSSASMSAAVTKYASLSQGRVVGA